MDARRAFPCWDEPACKAVFAVTLVVPDRHVAISNTRPVRETPAGPGRRAVTFADTIRMSTYLVAFVVGELEATEPVMVGTTPVRLVDVERASGQFLPSADGADSYLEFGFGAAAGSLGPGDELEVTFYVGAGDGVPSMSQSDDFSFQGAPSGSPDTWSKVTLWKGAERVWGCLP